MPELAPVQTEFRRDLEPAPARIWRWFKFLASTSSGYFLLETDAGIVTLDPKAARERILYERLLAGGGNEGVVVSQRLLIPESVTLPPAEAARVRPVLGDLESFGYSIEDFGSDTFKIDAVPPAVAGAPQRNVLSTLAHDVAESGAKRGAERMREGVVAKSIARFCAGAAQTYDPQSAKALVEELASCRMPYISPKGRPTMIFTSTNELDRKFSRR